MQPGNYRRPRQHSTPFALHDWEEERQIILKQYDFIPGNLIKEQILVKMKSTIFGGAYFVRPKNKLEFCTLYTTNSVQHSDPRFWTHQNVRFYVLNLKMSDGLISFVLRCVILVGKICINLFTFFPLPSCMGQGIPVLVHPNAFRSFLICNHLIQFREIN